MSSKHLAGLQALLPHGPAWPRDADSSLTLLLAGLAPTLDALEARLDALDSEADPRQADGLLSHWEWALGLDHASLSVFERRRRIVSRLRDRATPSVRDIQAIAILYGFEVAVDLFNLTTCQDSCDSPVRAESWLWAWRIRATSSMPPASQWAAFVDDVRHVAPPYTVPLFEE